MGITKRKVVRRKKPRIYWTYYPKSKRGYWRVSAQPTPRTKKVLDLWAQAHKMAREMNAQQIG